MRLIRRLSLVLGMAAVVPLAIQGTAQALVAVAPSASIPYLTGTDNYVRAADSFGGVAYVGGTITQVFAPATKTTASRSELFSYTESTGALTSFAPRFDGEVWGLAHSPDNAYLYVAGNFSTVNGVSARGLVRFAVATGALDTKFAPRLNGSGQFVRYSNGRLIVAGSFTSAGGAAHTALASLDPTTGNATTYINLSIAGVVASNAGATNVRRFAINPAGTRLVAIGNFTTVAGQTRWRALMLDLGSTAATLDGWNAPILQQQCAKSEPNYLWDVKFSPDGSYFAFVSTGYRGSGGVYTTVCDAASKWSTAVPGTATPVWANYTGGDSLYGVEITADAVYVTGHQRWLDNPLGRDSAGAGAVSRPGIGAIDPTTGRALSWNPTRSRGKGGDLLVMTSRGLLVGSDCAPGGISGDASSGSNYYNSKYHPCLALATGA